MVCESHKCFIIQIDTGDKENSLDNSGSKKMLLLWNLSPTIQSFTVPQNPGSKSWTVRALASERSKGFPCWSQSALETRVSLVLALASHASLVSQRFLGDLVEETAKYVFPRRFEGRTLDEALMLVPDLETVRYQVLNQTDQYEIRKVEPYYIAEVTMPGKTGFDFNGASQGFNVLAEYLFGKNTTNEQIKMTTPVITRNAQSEGEKMDMTTPVITRRSGDNWTMSFVMPSKYGANLPLPKDPSVRIREVPQKIVAVTAFSGFVTDEGVKLRESKLRDALRRETQFRVKRDALVEVSQYNPPFMLPFTRRNEIALEVEQKAD